MLTVSGNIKQRSVVIFCTGDAIQAVTVTSNSGFVRSARSQVNNCISDQTFLSTDLCLIIIKNIVI